MLGWEVRLTKVAAIIAWAETDRANITGTQEWEAWVQNRAILDDKI